MRALSEGKKSRVKCRSADFGSLSVHNEIHREDTRSTSSVNDSSTKTHPSSKEKRPLGKALSSPGHSRTRKEEVQDNKQEFASYLRKRNSKVSVKKTNAELSSKHIKKDGEKTDCRKDSLQRTTQEAGFDATDSNTNNPRKNSSTSGKHKSNVSQKSSSTTNEDGSDSSSRKESLGKTGKSQSASKVFPQKNEERKADGNERRPPPSTNENIGKDSKAENINSKPASSETNVIEDCTKLSDTKNLPQERSRGTVKLQRSNKTKVTKRPSNEKRTTENDRSDLNKNPSEKEMSNVGRNFEAKKTSSGRRFSGGVNKYQHERKESTESSRKIAFERRESYSKQLREKNLRNVELKKKMGMLNKGVRLQEDSAITVKIKHVKSRRLLRRNVAYVKREQKVHFSKEHDHDTWILFTVTMSSSLVSHVTMAGLDEPDGRNSPEFCKPTKALLSCVLPRYGNGIPKVKNVLVRNPRSNLKRLSLLPVKKLRWSLFDGMVMYLLWF